VDRPGWPERPLRLADDLRHRLADLPPGHPSSDRVDADNRGGPQADSPQRDYWSEVPGFRRAWAEHLRAWPAPERLPVDRSRDPAGSWRGEGNQYLTPEQHTQARTVIVGVRRAERAISQDMLRIEQDNQAGGWLAGWEFRRKGDDRVKEKLAEKLEKQPGDEVADVALAMNDAIRYTFCFESASYAEGYRDVTQRLGDCGHRMTYARNHWSSNPEYKGINTRWVTPDGQRFEVQFHTLESFHAKHELTHAPYERMRNGLTGRGERVQLDAIQREVSRWVPVPAEVGRISDHREEEG
jgi:hypothetical protein